MYIRICFHIIVDTHMLPHFELAFNVYHACMLVYQPVLRSMISVTGQTCLKFMKALYVALSKQGKTFIDFMVSE